MKKLFITGGAGFIGSEFVRLAMQGGYKITVVDAITYAGDKKRLKSVDDKITFHKALNHIKNKDFIDIKNIVSNSMQNIFIHQHI